MIYPFVLLDEQWPINRVLMNENDHFAQRAGQRCRLNSDKNHPGRHGIGRIL